MKEIICTSQAELDALSADYNGRVIIKFGTPLNRAVVKRRFIYPVDARENSSVEARENSSVVAWGNSSVVALENSSVVAWGNSSVVAWGNSSVVALENSSVVAWGNSSVVAWGNSSVVALENSSVVARENSSVVARENSSVDARENSSVEARENSSVVAWGNSSVVALENSSVVAWGNSSVVAWGNSSVVALENSSVVAWENSSVDARENSSVEARENSSVVAWGNSSVVAWGNSQIIDNAHNNKVKTNGNARIVYTPKNIEEYIDYHGLIATATTIKLYKAVHFRGGVYRSDYNHEFIYPIGDVVTPDNGFDKSVRIECGAGIHLAYKEWAVGYGTYWPDLAILECECEKSDVLVPLYGDGKVRARKAKVLREVPLEECGALGKIIAKRRANDE